MNPIGCVMCGSKFKGVTTQKTTYKTVTLSTELHGNS